MSFRHKTVPISFYMCDIPWYTVPAGILIIDVSLAPLGHIRMWRVRLSWESRVTCSPVPWGAPGGSVVHDSVGA